MSVVGIFPTDDDDGNEAEISMKASNKIVPIEEKPTQVKPTKASAAQLKFIDDLIEKKAKDMRTTSDNIYAEMADKFKTQPGIGITSDMVNDVLIWLGYQPKDQKQRSA